MIGVNLEKTTGNVLFARQIPNDISLSYPQVIGPETPAVLVFLEPGNLPVNQRESIVVFVPGDDAFYTINAFEID